MSRIRATLFRGADRDLAAAPDGSILAVGDGAAPAAGRAPEVVEVSGTALPGLHDAHLHLDGLATGRMTLDLGALTTRAATLARLRRFAERQPADAWVIGRGWYNDAWTDDRRWPRAEEIETATGGRPAFLTRKDGHSALLTRAGAERLGIRAEDQGPPGTVKEALAMNTRGRLPEAAPADYDRALLASLQELARLGLTSVHSMDPPRTFRALQRLHARSRLPVRVTWNLPLAELGDALRIGIRSGWGDDVLRIWGVKGFLDGSLGSRTAEMLDGSGQPVLAQADLREAAARAAAGELNLCLHAIGDGAVRRALDALEPLVGAWAGWRPRIEHAQLVDPADAPRFGAAGVIASMQPIHAVADRELADREWGSRCAHAYAWRALAAAGARLAFGSDAPVESADPLLGLDAATGWRRREAWYPELALTPAQALAAYTAGAAYAAGTERRVGRLAAGMLADVTYVDSTGVVATVMGGRVTARRAIRSRPT